MKHARSSRAAVFAIPILRSPPAESQRRRRGVALLVVLLLVAITLGLSYAMVRSQYTTLQIQRNSARRVHARQAALTGMTMALKKMHTGDWAGIDTTLTGSLGSYEDFQTRYTAGDPSLPPDDPDYPDFPYRVTLLSTGYAADPDNPACVATHQVRAVVRLLPRDFGDQPTDWATMQQYTVYQTRDDYFQLDIPCRIEGPVRVQGPLRFAVNYPNGDNTWSRYLGDLHAMRLAGYPDYRPLTGRVDLLFVRQDGKHLSALAGELAVTANDTPTNEAASDWNNPTLLASYQIYGGGPVYTIPTVNGTLENTALEPDPLTNPLGIYYRDGSVCIRDNVTIRGSLFCRYDIRIEGTNVHFEPLELPALHGADAPVRLPVASCKNFVVKPAAGGGLTGLLAVFDRFEIEKSPETVEFAFTGRVVTRKLLIRERQPWELLNWPDYYEGFQEQLDDEESVVPYFPVWMGNQGRAPKPLLTIKPDADPVTYHWKSPGEPVYVPHPDDDGLRWNLLEWTDNP